MELIARFPILLAYAYQAKRHFFDHRACTSTSHDNQSTAESILRAVRSDKQFTAEEARLLDLCLVLHAEHGGGNNSTFACRVVSSSGTDTYAAISAALSSLKGPLHGGANIAVMDMFDGFRKTSATGRTKARSRTIWQRSCAGKPETILGKSMAWGTQSTRSVIPARAS